MTRTEEIQQAADANFRPEWHGSLIDAFVQGAEWADEHPKSSWISVEDRLPEISGGYIVRYIVVKLFVNTKFYVYFCAKILFYL